MAVEPRSKGRAGPQIRSRPVASFVDLGQLGGGGLVFQKVAKTLEEQASQLRLAIEMHEFGVLMMRQSMKRQHPNESAEQIERRLRQWLQETKGPSPKERAGR